MMRNFLSFISINLSIAFLVNGFLSNGVHADVQRTEFLIDGAYLVVEVLDDDLVHFELSAIGSGPSEDKPLYTSPMVLKTDYVGASVFERNGNVIETNDMHIVIDQQNLCVEVRDRNRENAKLTKFCPADLTQARKGLDIDRGNISQVYGLGQQFRKLGDANNDWLAHGIREGHEGRGNGFPGFQFGAVGNVQIPVYYALGDESLNYATLLDNVYFQKWDFTTSPWRVRMFGDQIRWYMMTGPDLPDLRADYM